jgi:hypothetical protein
MRGRMRLYSGRIPSVAADIVRKLADAGDIEVSNRAEAELDVSSVLKEYLRVDREISDQARAMLEQRGLGNEQFSRAKRTLAEQRGLGQGEEAIPWICNQLVELFMHSAHIDEVFADDGTLRVKLRDILKKHMALDEELDGEARRRIQNLQEGTSAWEVEYARAMAEIKRGRGVD